MSIQSDQTDIIAMAPPTDAQTGPGPDADSIPPRERAWLLRRLQLFETAVTLERRLRRQQEHTTRQLRARLARQPGNTDALPVVTRSITHTAPTSTQTHSTFDPDATRLASRTQASPGEQTDLALPQGFMLHEYRIDRVLGQGGFGMTYLATDIHLNTRFAIKEYLPASLARRNSDFSVVPRLDHDKPDYYRGLDSFLQEARTLASFRHPNIVRVARFFEAHQTAYIVLDYEHGESLKNWWPKQRNMPESTLLTLLQPLFDGLEQMHAAGFLHRDIKPDNILRRDSDGSLVLLDFGAARQTSHGQQDLAVILTPGYAPLEQYQGEAQGPWTDVYAIGATLYWMIKGDKPPPAPERVARAMPGAQEVGAGRYSARFLQAIDRALALDASARAQSVSEFCQELYAEHSATLGLQAALRLSERTVEARTGWHSLRQSLHQIRHGRWLRPASWPLTVKMSVAMLFSALLPMTLTAWYNLNGSIQSVTTSELRNLERLAQSTAGRVAQLLRDSRHLADFLAHDPDFIDYLRQPNATARHDIEDKVTHLLQSNPDVHRVIVLDRDGKAILSNDSAQIGSDNHFRDYFKAAMQGQTFTTGMMVSHVDGTAGVYYANPIFAAPKSRPLPGQPAPPVLGVVVLRIKSGTISAILNDSIADTGRVPFLIDGDGVVIYHPEPQHTFRSLAPLAPGTLRQILAERRFGQQRQVTSLDMQDLAHAMVRAKTHGNLSYYSTLTQTREHVGYAPVGNDWVVGITESSSRFEAPLTQLFRHVLASVLIVGLLFTLLAVRFARSIVKPVLRLTEAAHALKEGDYDKATIVVHADDELGRLARTFNVMIEVLRQRDRHR